VAVKGNDHKEFGSGSCGSYSKDSEGFGLKVTCKLCVRKNRINIEREGAKSGQEQKAQKMVSLSNSILPAVDIGINVVVRVPDLDRGRTRSVRKVSDRIFLCEHLMDYNLARLHEPTLNLSAHA